MKIATWNVNSIKVRLNQVIKWIKKNNIDVLCLQETKTLNINFPSKEFFDAGYYVKFSGQKTYNGVAILSKHEISDVVINNPYFPDDQQRMITGTINGFRIICVYIPNGQLIGSEKFKYKLHWLEGLLTFLEKEKKKYTQMILTGDFNIAPTEKDVHDPEVWKDQVLVSDAERKYFEKICLLKFQDAFRILNPKEKKYTWWDYRQLAFQKNKGLRIDHILISSEIEKKILNCDIDKAPRKWEQPSDHAPVTMTLI